MIASSPAFLKCHECKKSPKQFTFLNCNHIICEKCIQKKIEFGHTHNSVMCLCGALTYFNEDSQVLEETNQPLGNTSGQNQHFQAQQRFQSGDRRSSLIGQRNSFGKNLSNQTIDQCSKTLINERSTMPMLEVSDVFSLQKNDLSQSPKRYQAFSPQKQRYFQGSPVATQMRKHLTGTQKSRQDQSLLLDNYQSYEPVGKRQNDHHRMINEFSTHQIGKSGGKEKRDLRHLSPKGVLNDVKRIKQSVIVEMIENDRNRLNGLTANGKQSMAQTKLNSTLLASHVSKAPHHSQFQSELSFLKILFQKDVEQIQYQLKKVLEKIGQAYSELEEQLRALYVEEVITKESLMSLNLSEMIKGKYDKAIGRKFKMLKDNIFGAFYDTQNRHNQNVHDQPKQKHTHQAICSYLNAKQPKKPNIQSNNASLVEDSHNQETESAEEMTTMNNRKVTQFDTIEEKLQRLTAKPRKTKKTDHVKAYNEESSKRIQTENIHTSIKRNYSLQNMKLVNPAKNSIIECNRTFHSPLVFHPQSQTASPQYRLTQKPIYKRKALIDEQEQKRNQVIYYSPPIPYCYKHLQKRQKESRDYIGFIEKLCHEKKMKGNRELFKKVKAGYEFAGRKADE